MSQSNVIFLTLFAAFVVFITMRGKLPLYMGFLLAPSGTGAKAYTWQRQFPWLQNETKS